MDSVIFKYYWRRQKADAMSEKKLYEMEFVFKASPNILFSFLTTPSGLTQWFADSVTIKDDVYTFEWSGSEERAVCLEKHEPNLVKFKWEESGDGEYFQFRIGQSEVTGDTILYVADFAEDVELDDQKMLWENQIADLQKRVGG